MLAMPGGGKMMRENVATTSAELNAVPSWNFTPSRSLNVYVLPSDDTFQLLREIRDDRFEAIRGVEAHEVVVHLPEDEAERALVHVEVCHLRRPRPLEHAAALGIGFGGTRPVGAYRRRGRLRPLQRPTRSARRRRPCPRPS